MNRNVIRFGRDKKASGIELKTGLSTAAIYDKSNPRSPRYDPDFPRRIQLSARAVGFFENEVDEWLARRSDASNIDREKQFQALQKGSNRFREDVKARKRRRPAQRETKHSYRRA
jgi:prophage regulatory protein